MSTWLTARELWAGLAVLGWLTLCAVCLLPGRRQASSLNPQADWLVAYASQSGTAQGMARQQAEALISAGRRVDLIELNQLQPQQLSRYHRGILIASSWGDGEPPDNAARFWRQARQQQPDLRHLSYVMLALGDSQYAEFCGFARQLDGWLQRSGARMMLPRIEVDQLDPAPLQRWHTQLAEWTGVTVADATAQPVTDQWQLVTRHHLNPGSPGAPVWLIRLRPCGTMPRWQAGDLARLRIGRQVRSYSLASLPEDGVLELLVRQVTRADGQPGLGSGWLCNQSNPGDLVQLQIQSNPQFHLPEELRPAILIGAGTGLAGLRSLLKQRQRQGLADNWLIFGERCERHDRWLAEELDVWAESGSLLLDRCFSRQHPSGEYVQQRLAGKADQLRTWVDRGATIHVCGSLENLGQSVQQTLEQLLSAQQWQSLQQHDRYRRDLY